MCYTLFFWFLFLFTTLIVFAQGCSNIKEKKYTKIPNTVHKQALKICNKIDGSHFIVRERRVWLRKIDNTEIELKHYKSILPDGYYLCSGLNRNSEIID